MRAASGTIAILLFFFVGAPVAAKPTTKPPRPNWTYVEKRLRQNGLSASFIKVLHRHYETKDFADVLELNCLLFLRTTDYHAPQVSPAAVDSMRDFMRRQRSSLTSAKKKYGVPGSVVAGLLWMESRYGDNPGRFHVASAYLHLVQATRAPVLAHLKKEAAPRFTAHLSRAETRTLVKKAKQKSAWAIAELKALQTMYKRDHKLVIGLRGSFAGAFGMPQFIPSSYVHYARAAPGSGKRAPDLYKVADAIHSVAYYLHASGWRQKRKSSHVKALLKYNNSRDYADAILKLARLAEAGDERAPASN